MLSVAVRRGSDVGVPGGAAGGRLPQEYHQPGPPLRRGPDRRSLQLQEEPEDIPVQRRQVLEVPYLRGHPGKGGTHRSGHLFALDQFEERLYAPLTCVVEILPTVLTTHLRIKRVNYNKG